eukprot:EG_transcript_433
MRLLCWFLGLLIRPAVQQDITIGMTGPLYVEAGRQAAFGLALAFQEANRAGGVLSRNLSLIALNDDYNVTTALANIHTLVDTQNVFLLAGVFGSEVVVQAKSFILQRNVPFVGGISGSPVLRTPFSPQFVNVRASYVDEMVMQALFVVQTARVRRVACMYQNDSFGTSALAALVAALTNVGMELVASGPFSRGTTAVEGAVAAIAGAGARAQAVVLVAPDDAITRFIPLFMNDTRADPGCIFTVASPGWASAYRTALAPRLWPQVYFFFVVPLPGDPKWAIAKRFASLSTAAGNIPDPNAFEGYIAGRLIVDVLRRTRSANPTRAMFLEEVYNDRLFVEDDLVLGVYSTNYSGCEQVLCSCNAGLRSVFVAQMEAATGLLGPSLSSLQYSALQCSSSVAQVVAPLLFGQLVPTWDDGWHAVAQQIGDGITAAFAEANAAGGTHGRDFVLLQQNYSSNATTAMDALADRYPLVALLGSTVPNMSAFTAPVPSFGNFDPRPDGQDAPFERDIVHVQPALALELMALAQWAAQNCPAVHLRSPATASGHALLATMTKSVHSFQVVPATAAAYPAGTDVLAPIGTGCVIALGSDSDVRQWYAALPAYPALHLCTPMRSAVRLMAAWPNASKLSQASRLHFPTMLTDIWNTTRLDPGEPWKYGYLLGQAVTQALIHSQYADDSYTTPAELLDAWYSVRVMASGALTLGPYQGDACEAGETECECNEGVRSLGVRTVASPVLQSHYAMATCRAVYTDLLSPSGDGAVMPIIVGTVVGASCCAAGAAGLLYRLTHRNNAAAPKDINAPFCILFTDIQASTHLWATIPDIMAPTLSAHNTLIRKAIAKHHCYEVKTIGDSFMCAARTPQQGMELALAVQTALHEHDWGTDAADAVYHDLLDTIEIGQLSNVCWNGLRVRIGIHFGLGDIRRDPLTQGYDYYGTVVNTAARIESVCHGGQIAVSQAVYAAVRGSITGVVWADLGPQPLRGLAEPLRLYQALPVGPLASRKFPPLRLDKDYAKDTDLGMEVEIVSNTQSNEPFVASGTAVTGLSRNSVAPSTSNASAVENWRWVETHPLVLHGDITSEELKQLYVIAFATLSTLLTTQTERFREQMLLGLCDRLHVAHHGLQGSLLQLTLRGLVHRVLPATVKATQQLQRCQSRQNSKSSLLPSPSPVKSARTTIVTDC